MKQLTIEECLPGQVVVKEGICYIVVEDNPDLGINGCVLKRRDGSLHHWSSIFKPHEIIELCR